MFTISGCKDKRDQKSEFEAKFQFQKSGNAVMG